MKMFKQALDLVHIMKKEEGVLEWQLSTEMELRLGRFQGGLLTLVEQLRLHLYPLLEPHQVLVDLTLGGAVQPAVEQVVYLKRAYQEY